MKKILITTFVLFVIILIVVCAFVIVQANTSKETEKNKEKAYYEIKYLDSKIIYIANLFNNLNDEAYSSYQETKWEYLLKNTETVYQYWSNTILDLNYFSIDKNDLTEFGKILDNFVVSIKNKDKQAGLNNLVQLYNKLLIYIQSLSYNKNDLIIMQAKYHLLVAYSIAENENWTLIFEHILQSDENLLKLINLSNNDRFNKYNIYQAYIVVKELENIINVQDIDVFYLKYKIAMQKLENI